MRRFYGLLARGYFLVATIALIVMALALLASAVWQATTSFGSTDYVSVLLDSISLVIIGFAVIETGKFVAEEEILRRRELRSAIESRRSLTKFITIIVIAASLEALVMIFKASRNNVADTVYPSILFMAAMLALVALGAYQWLSSRIEPPSEEELREAEAGRQEQIEATGEETPPKRRTRSAKK
jgi:hypothetical protein